MPYLIDSDVLIDVSRGKPAASEYIDALPEGGIQILPFSNRPHDRQSDCPDLFVDGTRP